MALTLYMLKRLDSAKLTKLFKDKRDLWKASAQDAYNFAKKFVGPSKQPVRPDDVLPSLLAALEVSDVLIAFLAEKRLGQAYWYKWFGALILDELWPELGKGK
jgi:hypothetical protein